MAEYNLFAEEEGLNISVNVEPNAEDLVENNKNLAEAYAETARLCAESANTALNNITDYKNNLEIFYAQASDNLTTLLNNAVETLNSCKLSILAAIQTLGSTVMNNVNNLYNNIFNSIQTLGQSYVNQARNYADEAKNAVDNRVSLEHLNQSKALETGDVSSDSDILIWLDHLSKSTFDILQFSSVGTPTITSDGIASGMGGNSTNYIALPITSLNIQKEFTVEWEGNHTANQTTNGSEVFIQCQGGELEIYRSSGNKMAGQIYIGGGTATQYMPDSLINTIGKYKVKYIFDIVNNKISYNYWQDNVEYSYTETMSNISLLNFGSISKFFIGGRDISSRDLLNDSIDLKQFSITVDGKEVFNGNKEGLDVIKPDDYTVVGTPTISADGIASGFSGSGTLLPTDYIVAPVSFSSASDFDIVIKNFTVSGNTSQRILTGLTSSDTELYCYIYRAPNSSGISFVFGQGVNGIVYCGITEGNIVNCKLSKRGNVLTWDVENVTKGEHPAPTVVNYTATDFTVDKILLGGGWVAWEGTIDLNGFEVYVDGDLVYQPCLKIPYTESKTGSKIVDAVYRERVKDMYEQLGCAPYYTLGENDFTLPMGELYGMLGILQKQISELSQS